MAKALCLVFAVPAFFLLLAEPGLAQQTPAAVPSPSPNQDVYKSSTVLRYTTRLVLVDVIATDHKGNPVTDLKKEDFVIEDGQGQQIDSFSFQAADSKNSPSSARPSPKLPPNILTNVPQYDPTRTLCILLLDGLSTETKNQVYARQEMIKFLEKLPAGQPVAVYALATKLVLLQDFTSDPAILKKAVMALESRNSPVLQNPTGGGGNTGAYDPSILGQLSEIPGGAAMVQQIQQFEQDVATVQTDMRVQMTLAALNAIARSLAGYPGRKNLIWLTQNFPLGSLANSVGETPSPRTQMNNRDYSVEAARTASILTDAQIALYPVDAGALVGNQVFASLGNTDSNGNYLGRTATGRSAGGMRAMTTELNRTGEQETDVRSAMNDMADRTGGKAYYGRNDVENAIQSGLDDGSSYYTLAYHPQNKKWNGKFRKISVKARRAEIKLRYRLGYYATDPEGYSKLDQRQRNAELGQALSPDFPVSTAVPFQARVFPPSEQTRNKLVANFGVDPHAIVFESDADGQHAEVDFAVAVYSKAGAPVKVEVQTVKSTLKPDDFEKIMKSSLRYQIQVELPHGDYVVRLGVRDTRTGLIGTLNTTVTAP